MEFRFDNVRLLQDSVSEGEAREQEPKQSDARAEVREDIEEDDSLSQDDSEGEPDKADGEHSEGAHSDGGVPQLELPEAPALLLPKELPLHVPPNVLPEQLQHPALSGRARSGLAVPTPWRPRRRRADAMADASPLDWRAALPVTLPATLPAPLPPPRQRERASTRARPSQGASAAPQCTFAVATCNNPNPTPVIVGLNPVQVNRLIPGAIL